MLVLTCEYPGSCVVLGAIDYWAVFALVVLVWYVVHRYLWWRRRSRCIRLLNQRQDLDSQAELCHVASTNDMPFDDVARLWKALADEYELPADRLRGDDRLVEELGAFIQDPNNDLACCPFLFVCDKEKSQSLFESCQSWSNLIGVIYKLERDCGHMFDSDMKGLKKAKVKK